MGNELYLFASHAETSDAYRTARHIALLANADILDIIGLYVSQASCHSPADAIPLLKEGWRRLPKPLCQLPSDSAVLSISDEPIKGLLTRDVLTMIGLLQNSFGAVYFALGEVGKALTYFEQALPIVREVGDRGGEATTLNNIGGVYSATGEMGKALTYYQQALPILRAVGNRRNEAGTLNNLGMVYRAIGKMNEALAKYEQALTIVSAVRAYPYDVASQVNIAVLLDKMGRLDEAIGRAGEAVMLMREKGLSHDGGGSPLAQVEQIYISLKRKRGG